MVNIAFNIILLITLFGAFGDCLERILQETTNRNDTQDYTRVYGGNFIRKDFPCKPWFIVMVKYFRINTDTAPFRVCTGTILTEKTILSSSDCLVNEGLVSDKFEIEITGKNGIKFTTKITSIENRDPTADDVSRNFALGFVDPPFDMTQVEAINLPERNWEYDHYDGASLTVCGYRNPAVTPLIPNQFISEATCNIFIPKPRTYCMKDPNFNYLNKNEICASSTNPIQVSACENDLGGPIYYCNAASKSFIFWGLLSRRFNAVCGQGPAIFVVIIRTDYDWIINTRQ